MRINVDIKKSYCCGGREFHLDAAFAVSGNRVVLFGPSGSGKTLTLRALAGLLRPDAGSISVDGREFFNAPAGVFVPPRERRIGYVFQDYALFPHLTVRNNVAFGLSPLWGRLSRDAALRVQEMMVLFGDR
ncbi:ATP-binding cassette domain-containing protein, partial [Desulfovibrio sp. DV]|uniref:ATP-binding cassette domain-containing protein n=1 Tax=Desulfovibrio sp. DV TaxID=1844708 RepID=UPI000AE30DB2